MAAEHLRPDAAETFREQYTQRVWAHGEDQESKSGTGSSAQATEGFSTGRRIWSAEVAVLHGQLHQGIERPDGLVAGDVLLSLGGGYDGGKIKGGVLSI